jgi:hypothetical protein
MAPLKQQLKLKPNYFKFTLEIINYVGITQTPNIILYLAPPFLDITQRKNPKKTPTSIFHGER